MTGDVEYVKCNISGNKKVGNFKYSGSKLYTNYQLDALIIIYS